MTWNADEAADDMWKSLNKFSTKEEMRSYFKRCLTGAYDAALGDAQDLLLRSTPSAHPIDLAQAVIRLRDTV